MKRRLPPFASLVAFEAVARHGSFTRAATELGVTQSAISHQVRKLEEFFGVSLLNRLNPGIELSDRGAGLLTELSEILERLGRIEARVRASSSRPVLRITGSSVLAGWWLIARLQSFRMAHPEIDLDFRPVQAEATVRDDGSDLSILWAPTDEAKGPCRILLSREFILPICAPSLLPGRKPLKNPADLLELPLIQKGHAPVAEWGWPFWLDKLRLPTPEPQGLSLADIGLCLQAASDGEGVAIGRSLLVADKIKDGTLVPALAETPEVISPKALVLETNKKAKDNEHVQGLVTWLSRAAAKTDDDVRTRIF